MNKFDWIKKITLNCIKVHVKKLIRYINNDSGKIIIMLIIIQRIKLKSHT